MNFTLDFLKSFFETIQPYQTSIATLGAALIAWLYNHNKNNLEKESFKRDLFLKYNAQYDKINAKLEKLVFKEFEINQAHQTGQGQSLNDIWEILFEDEPQQTPKFRYTINDYLNLCSEEYYWYKKGLVDDRVWKCWLKGMKVWYQQSEFIQITIKKDRESEVSYYHADFLDLFDSPMPLSRIESLIKQIKEFLRKKNTQDVLTRD